LSYAAPKSISLVVSLDIDNNMLDIRILVFNKPAESLGSQSKAETQRV